MHKRYLDCSASELLSISKKDLLDALRASEGRIVVSETIGAVHRPPPTLTNLQTFLEAIPAGDSWTVHCQKRDAMPLAAWAILLGGHVSIGLGDYPYSRFGKPRNSELVKRVADMSLTLGRPVATPAEARKILQL